MAVQLKRKKNKSNLSHFWCLKLFVFLCLYSVNVSGVCSMCISFVLSLCVQSFHKLNKLEPYVSLLLFYCSVYCSLVSMLSWSLMLALDSFRYLLLAISDEWLILNFFLSSWRCCRWKLSIHGCIDKDCYTSHFWGIFNDIIDNNKRAIFSDISSSLL